MNMINKIEAFTCASFAIMVGHEVLLPLSTSKIDPMGNKATKNLCET